MELIKLLNLYKAESINSLKEIDTNSIAEFAKAVIECYNNNCKLFACGNGGNAAYVANLITDLNLHPFVSEDKNIPLQVKNRFKGFNLCDSVSTITGITNDIGPDAIFASQLEIFGESGDVLLGLSGSGNSKNILQAFQLAKFKGMKTVLITRSQKGSIRSFADIVIYVPGDSEYPGQTGGNNNNFHYEDMISKISHMVTGILKKVVNESQPK